MKKLINQIFIFPVLFLLFGLISFGIFYYFFIEDVTKKEFAKVEQSVFTSQKMAIKNQLDNTAYAIDSIRGIGFDITEYILEYFLDLVHSNYVHYNKGEKEFFKHHMNKNIFFYIKSQTLNYPQISERIIRVGDRDRLIVKYNNKDYLAIQRHYGSKIIGIAFSLDVLNDIIKNEIKEYVSKVNKISPISYVAIGQVTDWNATNGVFGRVFYHPIKTYIGKELSINEPDIKGYPYRKHYFECVKNNKECFVSYYFKNPQTGEYEKKISYFKLYKPYNFILMKGKYLSTISKNINNITYDIIEDTKMLFLATLAILALFAVISFVLAFFISKKVIKKVLNYYDSLKTKYESSKKLLYERIYYDKVTNLPNAVTLTEKINEYKSLIIIDIDDFASINNLYGFETGNKILICVAKFLKSRFKNVYKVGSDEFAIPLKIKLKEKTLQKISKWEIECEGIVITFRIGASNIEKDLFITAESALKMAQKNFLKYLIYDENLKQKQEQKFESLKKIKAILKNEDIEPYYQCITDKNGHIVKYESLMRLKYGDQTLSPFMFMDLIKEFRLYHEFSRIMIKKVFKEVVTYNIENVSINLSFIDISEQKTRNLIIDLLKGFFIGDRITFEILESESIENYEEVKSFIKEVKEYGVKIAIDDFGSGYSNLINVLSLNPDFIKIDGSLIKHVSKKEYAEIIKLIIEFSQKFNIETIAEFVENEEIFNKLKELGIDYYQGYYFCKPASITEIKKNVKIP